MKTQDTEILNHKNPLERDRARAVALYTVLSKHYSLRRLEDDPTMFIARRKKYRALTNPEATELTELTLNNAFDDMVESYIHCPGIVHDRERWVWPQRCDRGGALASRDGLEHHILIDGMSWYIFEN